MKIDPLMGQQVGFLKIIAPASPTMHGWPRYFLRCVCGEELMMTKSRLFDGARKSCGCRGVGLKLATWTDEELDLLRREYPSRGSRMSGDVNKTPTEARRKANALKIKYLGPHIRDNLWTEEEIEIIRQNYEHGGTTICLPLLPTRSKTAIRDRAFLMGIQCDREHRLGVWSDKEVRILRRHYPSHGWEKVHKLLPHRSHDAIVAKATALGVHMHPVWSRKDEKEFRALYRAGGSRACCERWPDRSQVAIRSKARHLDVKFEGYGWPDHEIETVKAIFPLHGSKGVQKALPHRSNCSIWAICRRFGIRYTRGTEEPQALAA